MPKTPEALPPVRAISEDRLNFSRADHTDWNFSVPAGTPPEALLNSEYWKHVAGGSKRIRPRDIIHAECEDRSWSATYTVRDVGPYHIKLAILVPDSDGVCRFDKLAGLSTKTDTHYVEWINIGTMYVVRRKSDREIIEQKFRTPELAATWMHEHIRKIAA